MEGDNSINSGIIKLIAVTILKLTNSLTDKFLKFIAVTIEKCLLRESPFYIERVISNNSSTNLTKF